MATIASINFQPVKPNSTSHNERSAKLDYVSPHLTKNNESWKSDEITTRYASIVDLTKELTTRKIQAKATPIREAVVNLRHDHTMDDLKNLRDVLKKSYGIDAFQIHIHRDEGFGGKKDNFIGPLKLNLHAHMVFDWQDKKTGKSFKLNRIDMSKIQTLVAKTLGMDEGKSINNSNVVRLEATEYKRVQEEKRVHKLQEQVALLEQKKNELDSCCEEAGAKLYADSVTARDLISQTEDLERESERRISYIWENEGEAERISRENSELQAVHQRHIKRLQAGYIEGEETLYKDYIQDSDRFNQLTEEEVEATIRSFSGEISKLTRETELVEQHIKDATGF